MRNAFLKPAVDAAGKPLVVRHPHTGDVLPPAGGWRAVDEFFERRLNDKDVIETVPPADPASAPPRKSAKPQDPARGV